MRRPFVERTYAAKASIPSISVSKRIEWTRANECCAPGKLGLHDPCDETERSLARGLRIRSLVGGSRGLGSAGTETVAGRGGGMDWRLAATACLSVPANRWRNAGSRRGDWD